MCFCWKTPQSNPYGCVVFFFQLIWLFQVLQVMTSSKDPCSDLFQGLSDLHLGSQKVTLKKLVDGAFSYFHPDPWGFMIQFDETTYSSKGWQKTHQLVD